MEKKRFDKVPFLPIVLLLTFLLLTSCIRDKRQSSLTYDLVSDFVAADIKEETCTIDFRNEDSDSFLLSGWSGIEESGVWATSLSSEMKFFTFLMDFNQRMDVECFPYTYPNSPPQEMSLCLNGHFIRKYLLTPQKNRYSFLLPAEHLEKGENVLIFEFRYAESPQEVAGGKDYRTLSVHFVSIDFPAKRLPADQSFLKDRAIFFNPLSRLDYYYKIPAKARLKFKLDLSGQKALSGCDIRLGLFISEAESIEEAKVLEVMLTPRLRRKSFNLDLSAYENKVVRVRFEHLCQEAEDRRALAGFYTQLKEPVLGGKGGEQSPVSKSGPSKKTKAGDIPNLILVVLDAANPYHMGCYGYERETTPFLDQLAAEGLLFTKAYAQANLTVPSTASLFTSTYPVTHKVWGIDCRLSDKALTLAEALKEKGLATFAMVASLPASSFHNLLQGFEETVELFDFERGRLPSRMRKRVAWAEDFIGPGMEWVDRNKGRKFFMYLHILQPHEPYNPPEPFLDEFVGEYQGWLKKKSRLTPKYLMGKRVTTHDLAYMKAMYDANLKYADYYLHQFFEGLEERGAFEDSVVIVTADHGEGFFEHGNIGHANELFEEEIRIPLIIRFPERYGWGGREIDALVQSIDLMPTLLELCGATWKEALEGKSLLPLFMDTKKAVNEYTMAFKGSRDVKVDVSQAALSDGRYKLMLSGSGKLLFDLFCDPGEEKNLYFEKPILAGYYQQLLRENLKEGLKKEGFLDKKRLELDRKSREKLRTLGYID